jgi:hypothetical protein
VVAAVQQLAEALKGNFPTGNETLEALKKVSKLFMKIAAAKQTAAWVQLECNTHQSRPVA